MEMCEGCIYIKPTSQEKPCNKGETKQGQVRALGRCGCDDDKSRVSPEAQALQSVVRSDCLCRCSLDLCVCALRRPVVVCGCEKGIINLLTESHQLGGRVRTATSSTISARDDNVHKADDETRAQTAETERQRWVEALLLNFRDDRECAN